MVYNTREYWDFGLRLYSGIVKSSTSRKLDFPYVRFEREQVAADWATSRLVDWWRSLQPPAHAGSSLADFSTLKIEALRSSETSVHTRSTRRHIPEDGILQAFFPFSVEGVENTYSVDSVKKG
jgi:hypothetical protein